MKAFDLTASPERNAVQLTPQQRERLTTFMAADHQQIEDYFKGKGRTGFALDQAVERVEALCAACGVASEGTNAAQGTGLFTGNPRNRPGVVRGRGR